jgi:HK97 gp10 family phage protein
MSYAKLQAQLKAIENIPWICPVAMAEEIADIAREKAPVDTGFLRDHIKALHFAKHSRVDATAKYSGYLEFGTYRMKAQPFLRPAIREGQRQILEAVREAMMGEIEIAVKGGWVPAQYQKLPGRPKRKKTR